MSAEPAFVQIHLVPVEVFGGNDPAEEDALGKAGLDPRWSYGLCDAVQSWSDCNRAWGKIYRRDEEGSTPYRKPGETVTVYVAPEDMFFFDKVWSDSGPDDLRPERPSPERYAKALEVVEAARERHEQVESGVANGVRLIRCRCGELNCREAAALAAFDAVQP